MSTIPAETTYSDVELELIDNEPSFVFPDNQSSYWGQIRKVFADYLQQQVVDLLATWYLNLDPRTVNTDDIGKWEYMLAIPFLTSRPLTDRRASVLSRLGFGVFTRAERAKIIESYLGASFSGTPTSFSAGGIPFDASGITLYPEPGAGAIYTVTEDVDSFTYNVVIQAGQGFTPDLASLIRDLERKTPAHISFTVTVGAPVTGGTFGTGTFGSGTFGGGS